MDILKDVNGYIFKKVI